jgi:hypothetical protein
MDFEAVQTSWLTQVFLYVCINYARGYVTIYNFVRSVPNIFV